VTATVLTIAGIDSGGGAGVVADVKTITAHGCWALCAVTAVTAQDTTGVHGCAPVDPAFVVRQIEAVANDIGADVVKTGMLASSATVTAVADALRRLALSPLVVDPVMWSGHGDALLDEAALDALRHDLIPLAGLVTPNLAEAAALAGAPPIGDEAGMVAAAGDIASLGPRAVLVKGGHLPGEPVDILWRDGAVVRLAGTRLPSAHTHGTGCVLSAAIASRLAWGEGMDDAVAGARHYVREAITEGLPLGRGTGPVNPPGSAV